MNPTTKTLIAAVATLMTLSAGAANAQSPVFGYQPIKIGYSDSFNTSNRSKTQIDNSKRVDSSTRLNYDLDNSLRYKLNNHNDYQLRYDYRQNDINANQSLNQYRNYSSDIGQSAANVGGASGHSMDQDQGGTTVGALVSETNTSKHQGHSLLSPSFSSQYGSTDKGNMSYSQIGGVQSGMQMGDVTNLQGNDQRQAGASYVGSVDSVSNSSSQ